MPIPVSERKSMKNKKIIGLTLLSALLISGCTNANDKTTPIKDSTNTTINTESVESENYQYYPLPDGTLSIAVGNNRDLQYLTIPKAHHGKMVTQIADNGFANCTALKQINLPDSINVIGEQAFSGCSSLNSINIPDSTSVIGNYAFAKCSSLTSITIPDSVTSIGDGAFYECSWQLIIYCAAEKQPEGWNCDWNKNYSGRVRTEWGCEGGGTYLGLVYRIDIINGERVATILRYRGTESKLTIPGVIEGMKVVGIGGGAFYGCSSLTSVVIPEGVTSIGGYAFRGCSSLASIVIPGSVTSIGWDAFEGCSSLTIYCAAEKQPEGWDDDWNPSNRPVVWGYKSKP